MLTFLDAFSAICLGRKEERCQSEKASCFLRDGQVAFIDVNRVIARDLGHSETEERFFCFGKIEGAVLTVRFTYRNGLIRIFGAGFWRKGKQIYDKENNLLE